MSLLPAYILFMTTAVNTLGRQIRRLGRIPGPMLGKELLVTSRRGRSYVLRSAYLAAMMVYVVGVYLSMAADGLTLAKYEMPQVGKTIVASLAGFQLVGVTLAAVLLFSTAFTEEINRRTLGALLTTPLSDRQVILGKLAGRMIQLLALIILGLPMLIMLRVFGGVDIFYIAASTCVTLCSAVMAGALTLRLSLRFKGAFVTALASVGILSGYYLLTSLALIGCCPIFLVAGLANPLVALGHLTENLMQPGSGMPWVWPAQCAAMLIVAGLLVHWTAKSMRRVASERLFGSGYADAPLFDRQSSQRILEAINPSTLPQGTLPQAMSEPLPPPLPNAQTQTILEPPSLPGAPTQRPPKAFGGHQPDEPFTMEVPRAAIAGPVAPGAAPKRRLIRSVRGSPVLWKELQGQLWRRLHTRLLAWVIAVLVIVYMTLGAAGTLTSRITQGVLLDVYLAANLVALCIASAGMLARERESRSLTALLTTPMSDWRILADKSAAAILLAWPLWVLLVGNAIVFFALGVIHPLALALAAVSIAGTVGLHLGFALFLGSRLKRPTSVLAGNLLLGGALWIGLPIALGILRTILPAAAWDLLLTGNPFVQLYVAISGASWHAQPTYDFHWPGGRFGAMGITTFIIVAWNILYVATGALLTYIAKKNLRREA